MQSNDIKISIGLIVYNHEKYLRDAIESILMQEVEFKYEIIVGEDKSTDGSREILLEYKRKFPDKFVLSFQEKNVGGTKNIYDILKKSKGEYITLLEGDDYWTDKNKLQKQIDFLESNKDYLGVSHIIEARDIDGNYISRHPFSSKIVGKDVTTDLFLKGYYFSAVATVFKNIFLDQEQDYSIYYKAHKYIGDLTLCMILLDKGKIKVLDEVMSVYRCRRVDGESNYNSIRNPYEQYKDHIELLNVLNKYFNNKYDFTKEYVTKSSEAFILSTKYKMFYEFYRIYKTIPYKSKFIFWMYLPTYILKFILKKINLYK